MKITFLGTSHGYCEKNRFCSSAAVTVRDRTYVIDAGAPIMCLLKTYDIPYTSVHGIFITHAHQDHYGGLVEFINQIEGFNEYSDVHIHISVPPEFPYQRINTYLFGNPEGKIRAIPGGSRQDVQGSAGRRITFGTYPDGIVYYDNVMKITSIPVEHMPNAHAFLLEAEGKRVLFTGDLKRDFPDYPAVLTEGDGVDLVIIEAAHSRMNKPENIELFRKTKTKQMIVTHRNPGYNTDAVIADMTAALADLFPVTDAYDGMTVEL